MARRSAEEVLHPTIDTAGFICPQVGEEEHNCFDTEELSQEPNHPIFEDAAFSLSISENTPLHRKRPYTSLRQQKHLAAPRTRRSSRRRRQTSSPDSTASEPLSGQERSDASSLPPLLSGVAASWTLPLVQRGIDGSAVPLEDTSEEDSGGFDNDDEDASSREDDLYHVVSSDNTTDEDISDIDDVLLGAHETFQGQRQDGGVWKKTRRKKKKRKERQLFRSKPRKLKKKTAATASEMTPEVEALIKDANEAYFQRDIPEAIHLLEKAIRLAPGLHDPFHLLGLIYEEELKDPIRALDAYVICAHLVPQDFNIWQRVAVMSREQGNLKQAIYAYKKAVRVSDDPLSAATQAAAFELAGCYITLRDYGRAARCLEVLHREHPEDALLGRELAKCYYQQDKIDAAIAMLEGCVSTDVNVLSADVLSDPRFLTGTIRKREDGTIYRKLYDINTTNMLVELYINANMYQKCVDLLLDALSGSSAPPVELLIKLGVCQLYLGETESYYISTAFEQLRHHLIMRKEEFVDLYLLAADAFAFASRPEEALQLYTCVASIPSVWVKIARCQLLVSGHTPDGTVELSRCMFEPDAVARASVVRNLKGDAKARMLLSQVIANVPRRYTSVLMSAVAGDGSSSSAEGLALKLPDPIPYEKRLELLHQLQDELRTVFQICGKKREALTEQEDEECSTWILKFITLVEDSELDIRRAITKNVAKKLTVAEVDADSQQQLLEELGLMKEGASNISQNVSLPSQCDELSAQSQQELTRTPVTEPSRSVLRQKSPQQPRPTKLPRARPVPGQGYGIHKSDGAPLSLEDILGHREFLFFIETGIGVVMKSAGMYRAGVELAEAIMANRRAVRAHTMILERRQLLQMLKRLSLQLSIDGGLYRVALSYMREKYLHHPEGSSRALQAYGRLLFCGTFAHTTLSGLSRSIEREALLENRGWCIRQLLQRPTNFVLALLVGHFCSLSGRWALAVGEYIRAHRFAPQDDLPCICLATALLNLASSRTVGSRHKAMLEGFSMLSVYAERRRRTQAVMTRSMEQRCQQLCEPSTSCKNRLSEVESEQLRGAVTRVTEVAAKFYDAETDYNFARLVASFFLAKCRLLRACHHMSLVNVATPLYLRVISLMSSLQEPELRSAITLTENFLGPTPATTILKTDAPQIVFCASQNLTLIHKTRGAMGPARWACRNAMVWED